MLEWFSSFDLRRTRRRVGLSDGAPRAAGHSDGFDIRDISASGFGEMPKEGQRPSVGIDSSGAVAHERRVANAIPLDGAACEVSAVPEHVFPEPEIRRWPRWVRALLLLGGIAGGWLLVFRLFGWL